MVNSKLHEHGRDMAQIRTKKGSVSISEERIDKWVLDYANSTVTVYFSEGYEDATGEYVPVKMFALKEREGAKEVLEMQDLSPSALFTRGFEILDARRAFNEGLADTEPGRAALPGGPVVPEN